jgi:hypothetical protein
LAKVVRRVGEQFDCANWLHKAQQLPMQQFKDEVEKYLTGDSKPSELIYFKVYRSQIPVIEQALEIAPRMLGSDKSRRYCLEMIQIIRLHNAAFLLGNRGCSAKAEACNRIQLMQ